MSKLIKLSVAALVMCAVALPVIGQDKARTFSLKTKDVKGQVLTEAEEESGTQKLDLVGVGTQTTDTVTVSKQTTEMVEVAEDGRRTQARITWVEQKTTTTQQNFGEETPGDPVEEDGPKKGAAILWSLDKEKKTWSAKVESGEADALKDETGKVKPFANPLVPERDVKLGDEWEPTDAELKEAFPPSEGMTIIELKATCKAAEIVKEGGKEYLKVTFNIEGKGKLEDENIGKPEFSIKNDGHYLWDIAEGRVSSVESEREMAFETEVESQMGKLTAKFTGTGKSKITMTYGKKEEKKEEGN